MRVVAVASGIAAALALELACTAFQAGATDGGAAPEGGLDADASPGAADGNGGADAGIARSVVPVVTGANPVTAVAADESYVYWTERVSGVVGRVAIDGTGRTRFDVPPGAPADILVTNDGVFWANDNDPGAVFHAGLDGGGAAPFWTAGAGQLPQTLAVTPLLLVVVTSDSLFWLDRNSGGVVGSVGALLDPFGVATHGEDTYWSESGTSNGHVWLAIPSNAQVSPLASNQVNAESIAGYADSLAWISYADERLSVTTVSAPATTATTKIDGNPISVAADGSGIYVLVQIPDVTDASAAVPHAKVERFSWTLAGPPESLVPDLTFDDYRRTPHKIALTKDFVFVAGADSLLRVSKAP